MNHPCKVTAFDEFHGDEGLAVGFVNLMDGGNIGMIQGRRCLSFAQKALLLLTTTGGCFRQELQRDSAFEFRVLGFVDHAHPTTAEFSQYLIV
jgi:hypothetical protein